MSVMNKTSPAVRSGQWVSTCLKPPGRNPAWQWAAAAEGPGLRTGRLARGMPPGTLPPPRARAARAKCASLPASAEPRYSVSGTQWAPFSGRDVGTCWPVGPSPPF
jgi:hypothetical protein